MPKRNWEVPFFSGVEPAKVSPQGPTGNDRIASPRDPQSGPLLVRRLPARLKNQIEPFEWKTCVGFAFVRRRDYRR